jgi:hypothetical protein
MSLVMKIWRLGLPVKGKKTNEDDIATVVGGLGISALRAFEESLAECSPHLWLKMDWNAGCS